MNPQLKLKSIKRAIINNQKVSKLNQKNWN